MATRHHPWDNRAPRLRIEFRHPRLRPGALRAPEARTFLFDAELVRMLTTRAVELGRAIHWVMDGAATLQVAGTPSVAVHALVRTAAVAENACSPDAAAAVNRPHFRIILPVVDLQRLLAHPDRARLIVIRHAGDECWLACITARGAVESIRHNPLDVLRVADDLLLAVVRQGACAQIALRSRIEAYLRERHLIH